MRKAMQISAVLTFMGLAVLLAGFGSAAEAAPNAAPGALRIVQASPDTATVDVVVNGQKLVSALKYQSISDYLNLPGGNYDIKIYATTPGNQGAPAVDLPNYSINTGSINTLVIAGLSQNKTLTAVPLSDNTWTVAGDKAKVRFVHGSFGTPAVDINVSGLGDVFKNISFKSTSSYMEITPGQVTLNARLAATNQVLLTKSLNFEAGKVYTVYATGLLTGQGLGVVVSLDNSLPVAMPPTGLGGAATAKQAATDWQLPILLVALVGLVGGSLLLLRRRATRS